MGPMPIGPPVRVPPNNAMSWPLRATCPMISPNAIVTIAM